MNAYCAKCGKHRGWFGKKYIDRFEANLKPCLDCGSMEIVTRKE